MDETNASSIISSKTAKTQANIANNMETKSINIPTNAHHHRHEEATSRQSSQSNTSISRETTQATATTSSADASSSEVKHGEKSAAEDVVDGALCASRKPSSIVSSCEPDIVSCEQKGQNHHPNAPTHIDIDPLKESTNNTNTLNQLEKTDNNSSSCTADVKEKVVAGCSELGKSDSTTTISGDIENDSFNKGAVVSNSNNNISKPLVPNFRVEGSGAGDSSITTAVASLSSAVSASVSRVSGGGGAGGTAAGSGSNSLEIENGDQPGSSSGPVSIQSSEEMRLSLVSWYSEPEEIPSRLIEGCCSALKTYRTDENGIVIDEIGSSMGHEAISSVTDSSPVCKSESEEKENKTPEPCGNIDKMNGGLVDDKNDCTNGTFTKLEFINPVSGGSQDEARNANQSLTNNKTNETCNQNSSTKSTSCRTRDSSKVRSSTTSSSQKTKGHVPSTEHNKSCSSSSASGHTSRCQGESTGRNAKPECPRCSRRSKSGTNTPASSGQQIPRNRTPASRRVVQSSKSSTEIKKPIKSILKHESRGSAGSGSGSDKQSSMDSLGSSGDIGVTPPHILRGRMPGTLMTRSDSGTRARFNFSTNMTRPTDTPTGTPEDKAVSKLKRIEKYATLRVRKNAKPRPVDFSEGQPNDATSNSGKVGAPGVPTDMMSKSMSYLEKSSNRVHISSTHGHTYGESTSASSTLKRQGSLRVKKHSSPQWEPSGTRTSALRLQKMQEAKAKTGGGGGGGASSGSANSGSGDSLHHLPHSANSMSGSGGSSGLSSIHLSGTHSAPSAHHHGRMSASAAAKEKHMGAKVFSKLSSALGQTASSNQKRVRQERGIQTDILAANVITNLDHTGRMSVSPVPLLDSGQENVEQIKNLERLCNRYRNQFMKIQSEFEKSESRKVELQKQLEETQTESSEMIDFLQAEKSTLAESLTEVEVEAKKWKDEMEAVKKDYESRCSSLVRLSEQHKQEALKSQALLHRLETQSTSVISQLSRQVTDGAQNIQQTRQRVTALTDSLLKTYKVPPELLASSETNQTIKETDLSCSLLLPLITSLSAAFPMIPIETIASNVATSGSVPASASEKRDPVSGGKTGTMMMTDSPKLTDNSTSMMLTESSSLQSLNQAILEREAAEKTGLEGIMKPFSLFEGVSPDMDQFSLSKEITDLNMAIAKLLCVVRVIVIHCDRKVSSVASSILQCLKSIEDDKVGNMAEIAQVQKSLEAWSDKGGASSGSSSSTSTGGSPPFKTSSTSISDNSASYLVGNGHAHV